MQNVELVLKAAALMKENKDISFFIVGSGVNEERLKTFAKEKELSNVTFVGMRPPEEVADLYSAADVNLIPLQRGLIYAALPSKTADCLIAGRPIITCVNEHSSFAELMESNGYFNVNPENADKLSDSIKRVKDSVEQSAEKRTLTFSRATNVKLHCESIENL